VSVQYPAGKRRSHRLRTVGGPKRSWSKSTRSASNGSRDPAILFHLSGTDERGGIGPGAPLQQLGRNHPRGARHQLAESASDSSASSASGFAGFRGDFFKEKTVVVLERTHRNRDATTDAPPTGDSGAAAARARPEVHSHQDCAFRLCACAAGPAPLTCQSRPLPVCYRDSAVIGERLDGTAPGHTGTPDEMPAGRCSVCITLRLLTTVEIACLKINCSWLLFSSSTEYLSKDLIFP